MRLICQELSWLVVTMDSTSEACLALAHGSNLCTYIELQPRSLEQHFWVRVKLNKLFYATRVNESARDPTSEVTLQRPWK